VEIDHVFIMCDAGAPGADALLRLGLREGSPNTHPGQGTACRRFFFANAYLELLWVDDEAVAGSDAVKRTRLLDRWALRRAGACPFGVILRPTVDEVYTTPRFPTWRYTPPYLPDGLAIEVAAGTPLTEPEIFYLAFRRTRGHPGEEPLDHAIPTMGLHHASISGPVPCALSTASLEAVAADALSYQDALAYTLTLDFRSAPDATADLRPELPLILRW
jgi:hypothetical protein